MPSTGTSDVGPETCLTPTLRTPSEHQDALLRFFALHRIATPNNIMDVFPVWFTYHQKAIRHLNWLTNHGYLRRHSHDDGYVYNITNTGYERCRDIPNIDLASLPYHYEEPTGRQVDHELLITKAAISIYRHVRLQPSVQVLQEGRFMLSSVTCVDRATGDEVHPFADRVPDYWYLGRDHRGMMIRFLEVIAGEESMTRVRNMFAEYEQWGRRPVVQQFLRDLYAKWGAEQPQAEFEVHCILESRSWKHTDAWKERMTMLQTFHVAPSMQGRVWTTTREAFDQAVAEGFSINHAIWRRGKDLLGDNRRRFEQAREGTRTRVVDDLVRRLPTYSLFA